MSITSIRNSIRRAMAWDIILRNESCCIDETISLPFMYQRGMAVDSYSCFRDSIMFFAL